MKKIILLRLLCLICASLTVHNSFSQVIKRYDHLPNYSRKIQTRLLKNSVALMDNINLSIDVETFDAVETPKISKKHQVNFFIISRRHKGKLDLGTRYNILRTKLRAYFRIDKFVSIVASDAQKASSKIVRHLSRHNARIGTIWFDSHGKYARGHSLFLIGKDEISYQTLEDTAVVFSLSQIAVFADDDTKVVIGACYGGATYFRPSIDYKDTTRMNGDSLMFGLGKIFTRAIIYGCESWVMGKPGLFLERGSVAGFPGRNLFHDICYRPAWETIGKWNEYNAATKTFTAVNPVTLDENGNLKLRAWAYTGHRDVNEDILKNLEKLQPGLYK
ncbi:MAG: hypothetical protein ABIT96_00080 [Ferruginibacter sp.]